MIIWQKKFSVLLKKKCHDNISINSLTAIFAKNNAYPSDFAKAIVDNFLKGLDSKEPILFAVQINGKYGFINIEGKEVIPLVYDYTYRFSDGMATVKLNNKWGFISCYNWVIQLV